MDNRTLDPGEVRIFCGSSNRPLAADIARDLGIPMEDTRISRFSNDNLYIQLCASVRSRSVFIVQSLSPPVNDHLVELLMMLDIARSAAAKEVHAIIPYFSFARSDKKDAPRISITARLIADLLQTAGATHVMTMMLHSPQVHGFFGVPADPLSARPILSRHFLQRDLDQTIVVVPDVGNAKSGGRFAKSLKLPVAAGYKERLSDTAVHITGLMGPQVRGFRRAIIFDDEVATGSSVVELSHILIKNGVEEIAVVCTHGVFVGGAFDKLGAIPQIKEIVTTDTVHVAPERRPPHLHILSVAPIFSEAIRRNYFRESIGELFVYGEEDED
jgi:ribose-phosphate pyrophosphokinase